jgi:hypothetical protein
MLVKVPVELLDRYILYDAAPLTALQLRAMPDEDCAVALSPVGAARAAVVPLTGVDPALQPAALPAFTVK